MISGLLWFDDDPRKTAERKIGEAALRYLQRFGAPPTLCLVHQPASAGDSGQAGAAPIVAPGLLLPLAVVGDRRLRPNHYWLGLGEPESSAPDADPPAGPGPVMAR